MTLAEFGPQPMSLCARTVIDQSGVQSTVKLAVSVVPDTVCLKVPAPSLPLIVISYWSTWLSPGTAALQVATSVAVVAPCAAQCAVTPPGADGAIDAGTVVTSTGFDDRLDPPMVVLTTLIWYMVFGRSGPTSPFATDPLTVAVTSGAAMSNGLAVRVEDVIAAGLAVLLDVQEIWNWSPA